MADESQGERRWIVEPPRPGEIKFHMSFGEGVELTSEQEAALSELTRSLESSDAEVTGLAKCSLATCTDKTCKPVKCDTYVCHGLTADLSGVNTTTWSLMGTFGPS